MLSLFVQLDLYGRVRGSGGVSPVKAEVAIASGEML